MTSVRRSSASSFRARPGRNSSRSPDRHSMGVQIPARFTVGEEDEEEDVTGRAEPSARSVQQSFYGMLGAAGQKQMGRTGFWPDSGSESDGDIELEGSDKAGRASSPGGSRPSSAMPGSEEQAGSSQRSLTRQSKSKISDTSQLRRKLKPVRERAGSIGGEDQMSQSQFLPPREPQIEAPERPKSATGTRSDAPMLDRKLKAKAKADLESSMASSSRIGSDRERSQPPAKQRSVDLPSALAEIFQFGEAEEIIAEYACWYLQSVLLQGYMYITRNHVCFYAYMPKRGSTVVKSGHLGKQGKRNPRYRRYWCQLKGDTLYYYADAADLYFPRGTIDLRYGISAEMVTEKGHEKSKDSPAFIITTDSRTYHFRADSVANAKEWIKQLQKIIFRSHNDGDSVKISLSLQNVVDVEAIPVIDFAETIKLRVIDNDETYAVDEYFFTFFEHGKDARVKLNSLTQSNEARKLVSSEEGEEHLDPLSKGRGLPFSRRPSSPGLSEGNDRSGDEQAQPSVEGERTVFNKGGRVVRDASQSGSRRRHRDSQSSISQSANESGDSFFSASEQTTASPTSPDGAGDIDMSASQMLTGDGAFQAPTLRMPASRAGTGEQLHRELPHASADQTPTERTARLPPSNRTQLTVPTSGKAGADSKQSDKSSATTPARPAMQVLAAPLQPAASLYGHMRNYSKRGLSYLSSSPKDYYGKFSTALAGGKRHYSEADDALAPDDVEQDPEDDMGAEEHEKRFQQHFALPETEKLLAVFYCSLHRVLPLYGKIYIGARNFCFRSLLYGTRTKIVIPLKNIDNLEKEKGFRWGYPGMVVVIRGHEELFFDFSAGGLRDDCVVTVFRAVEKAHALQESTILSDHEKEVAEAAAAERDLLHGARNAGQTGSPIENRQDADPVLYEGPPVLFDDLSASMLDFKPKQPLRITCLTIGSRGDVQPYIALCKGLKAEGHHPRIATHHEFGSWVKKHGIDFVPVEGDPAELMRICVEYGMFTPSFLLEVNSKFRGWLDTLLNSAWEASKGSDLLIESPSAMAGIHIAEALGIPYFRAFTMPWTRTRAYPHAFSVPTKKMGGHYNYYTYTIFDNLFWRITAGQINRWRWKSLGLQPTSLEKLQQNKVPFLYNFSPSFVVPPLDFSDWVRVTGYWFLDEGDAWTPPEDLMAFIKQAREDKQKLVYIGFGSVTVADSKQLTQQVVNAVLKADVRCILSKGWSDRLETKDPGAVEVPLPPSVFQIRSAPHDWLFRQIDAAVHHGGAGTTGASLRAGVPTIIKPFFGDQYFFATRVEDVGVGIHLQRVTVNTLGRALWIATHDERMRTKARVLGERIRSEDGVGTAIKAIYRDLDYARSLIKKRPKQTESGLELEEPEEESWTFVENDGDVTIEELQTESESTAQDSEGRSFGLLGRGPYLGSMGLRGRST
ncbi:glycosyltransferase family 1 protein [Hortaea werneckii]|nr:glycosyltransferase family 1 protein [Hortaea werneckii]